MFDWPLSGIGTFFEYALLLWALVVIRQAPPGNRVVEVARNAVFTIVAAFAAIAFLAFTVDVGSALFPNVNRAGEAAAGPLGLLVAGTALVWPVACSRIAPARRRRPGTPRRVALGLGAHGAVWFLYWLALYFVIDVNPFTNPRVLAGTVAAVVLVPLLARSPLGAAGMPWLVPGGMLGIVLGATIFWHVLYFNAWNPAWEGAIHVNVLGK